MTLPFARRKPVVKPASVVSQVFEPGKAMQEVYTFPRRTMKW